MSVSRLNELYTEAYFFSEKIIHMPITYQPHSPISFSFDIKRSDFNLPENAFILGCFSRIEKILPNIFDIWMNILNKFKDTYLALCINNEIVKRESTRVGELNLTSLHR